ncbi:hypothetical protein, partial [Lactonifactor longoviformis]|uniref:hypothetical protein n=1 Tax=Lactonifactor longoviformis TaxID=341220 RepID=UPI001A9A3ED0
RRESKTKPESPPAPTSQPAAKSILSPGYGKVQGEVFVEQGASLFISENEVVILCRRLYNICENDERSKGI